MINQVKNLVSKNTRIMCKSCNMVLGVVNRDLIPNTYPAVTFKDFSWHPEFEAQKETEIMNCRRCHLCFSTPEGVPEDNITLEEMGW